METNSEVIARYHAFHDWYIHSVSTDMRASVVELGVMFDNGKDRARILFKGATRCVMRDFLIQNIIYSIDMLTNYEAEEYKQARSDINDSFPWGKNDPPKPIASVYATMGAELLIEFDLIEVYPE